MATRGTLAAEVIGRPAVNVAIFAFSVPLTLVIALGAFVLGWLGSVTGRQPSDPARFARIQVRALTGASAERGGHS